MAKKLPPVLTAPVEKPGLYDLEHDEYHADPCPVPSLNHTVAKIIHDKSPHHAFKVHPRLGGEKGKAARIMDIGSAAHTLAIGAGAKIAPLRFKDYRTKAAQETRDALIASGVTPLLQPDYDTVQAMFPLLRAAIEDVAGAKIDALHRELSVIGKDGESWSRCKPDVMTPDLRLIIDAKTTASAHPDTYGRMVMSGYATAVAFTFQTLDLIDPEGKGKRRYVFVVQERDYPEAITYHELDPTALELADAQMKRARLRWTLCSHTNSWPAYDRGPHMVVPRQFEIDDELDRQFEDASKNGGAQ